MSVGLLSKIWFCANHTPSATPSDVRVRAPNFELSLRLVKYGTNGIDGQHRSRSVDHERRRRHRVFGELEERQERMYESQQNSTFMKYRAFSYHRSTLDYQASTIDNQATRRRCLESLNPVSTLITQHRNDTLHIQVNLSTLQRQRRLVDTGYSRILFVRVQRSVPPRPSEALSSGPRWPNVDLRSSLRSTRWVQPHNDSENGGGGVYKAIMLSNVEVRSCSCQLRKTRDDADQYLAFPCSPHPSSLFFRPGSDSQWL